MRAVHSPLILPNLRDPELIDISIYPSAFQIVLERHLQLNSAQLLSEAGHLRRIRLMSDVLQYVHHNHDILDQPLPSPLDRFKTRWSFLSFGNLGTTVAIGRRQSETLHLDVHDGGELPTILMVLGREG